MRLLNSELLTSYPGRVKRPMASFALVYHVKRHERVGEFPSPLMCLIFPSLASRVTVASAMDSLSTRFSATTCSKTCTAPVRRASSTNRSWQPYGSRQGTQRGAAHSSDQTSFSLLRIGSDTLNHCRAPALPSILNLRISFHCETGSPTSARPRRFGKPWTSFYSDTLSARQNSRL